MQHRHCLCHPAEVAAYVTGTIKPHPFIYRGKIVGKNGMGQLGKDYNSKITVSDMYIFQWSQQNIVMTVYLLICWDFIIIFVSHIMILMKFRDRKTRTVWDVLNNCWKVKERHLQYTELHREPTYILTNRNHEIQVHTIDSKLLIRMDRERRWIFFNIFCSLYTGVHSF